ncbi:CIC11C00000001011 [Sungouiella intermedia]|uniref:CIC11C00000001011 n=1 Tax=Sungouiella intermedia TaxID=45354 RepID=A0A1L0BDZ3_9ASCO|nr:CIC11C00000001011 [[Candida] intermedia]
MARGKKFDKKTAQTFNIVHRSHEDSLYFDNDASKHVLVPAKERHKTITKHSKNGQPKKILNTAELEQSLTKEELASIRENEGLAAQYGIFFDDSKYDYMQHLRPIGQAANAVFIAKKEDEKPQKKNIEDMIKDALPSEKTRRVTHDTFENIPRELRGFNPDMDPRLREVLEALEDEAYVEGEEKEGPDMFADLLQSGEVEDEEEFYEGSDYDEWDMDNYDDEFDQYALDYEPQDVELINPYGEGEAPEGVVGAAEATGLVSNAWEQDFKKFKHTTRNETNDWDSDDDFDEEDGEVAEENDVVGDLPAIGKKKPKNKIRKKMGAMTDTSAFSMTSSALFRSEGLTLLDDRYEQLVKKFEEDEEEEEPQEFNMKEERQDFEGMLDDFLDNYELERGGRKLVKKDATLHAIRDAADSVSKSKLAARRKKQTSMGSLGGSFGNLRI